MQIALSTLTTAVGYFIFLLKMNSETNYWPNGKNEGKVLKLISCLGTRRFHAITYESWMLHGILVKIQSKTPQKLPLFDIRLHTDELHFTLDCDECNR